MVARKEIIILNGGGHKGIVKISGVTGKDGFAKVSCSLDFRPNNAKLYLIGDNVAQMTLNNTNCEYELPFSAKYEIGCVLRSSSVTMFGGSGSKSEMLKKIEAANSRKQAEKNAADKDAAKHAEQVNPDFDKPLNSEIEEEITDEKFDEEVKTASVEETEDDESDKNENKARDKKQRSYVGVSDKSNVKQLGDWTKYDGNNFYYAVKPQIDEMFVCYPEEELLISTVPNSKWVRVDAEDGYYVVGLLYDEDEPSFICYGVPQYKINADLKAPEELENMCVWLPTHTSEEISGYWIIYQSAKTGEIIK